MLVSVEWLNSMLTKKITTDEVVKHLESAGVEVDEVIDAPLFDTNLVVGQIKRIDDHPDADKLRVAHVFDGQAEFQVVCGAPNIEQGQKVPFARVDAKLPDGTAIKKASIRGVESSGMLCSQRELSLGNDHEGILILPDSAKVGSNLAEVLAHSDLLDVSTAANRSDLQSIYGLAREVAAHGHISLRSLPKRHSLTSKKGLIGDIDRSLVDRFSLVEVELASIHITNRLYQQRLESIGSSLNGGVVDITNIVMHEHGQPMHAFDADKVVGPISVRFAKKGETLMTIDQVVRKLSEKDVVVADSSGPIALAGVMGGSKTEVGDTTKRVFLECAVFTPTLIRKTAMRQGMRTDASARFERGLPVELSDIAIARALELFSDFGKIKVKNYQTVVSNTTKADKIPVSDQFFTNLAGFEIKNRDYSSGLANLGFDISKSKNIYKVTPPWWRSDVSIPEDVFEEVIKIVGLEAVPSTLPTLDYFPKDSSVDIYWQEIRTLRQILLGFGYFELVTYPFISKSDTHIDVEDRHIALKNPRSVQQSYMRHSALPSHISVLKNHKHLTQDVVFFETYNNFYSDNESKMIAFTVRSSKESHLQIARILEMISDRYSVEVRLQKNNMSPFVAQQFYSLLCGDKTIGCLGLVESVVLKNNKVSGELSFLELNLGDLLKNKKPVMVKEKPVFQSAYRDLSVDVQSDVVWADITSALSDENIIFIDEYHDGRTKTITFKLVIDEPTRTPNAEDVERVVARTVKKLQAKCHAKIQR